MSGWKKFKIKDVVYINPENYSTKDQWDYINYLETSNLTEGRIDSLQKIHVGIDKIPSRAKRKVKVDDVLISTVRPNQKHYGIIRNFVNNFVVSTGFAVLRANQDMLDPYYLYLLVTQDNVTEYLSNVAEDSTTAYPSITPNIIGELDITLPPLLEQKAIAEILRSLDDKIDLLHRNNQTLEAIADTIFRQWFVEGNRMFNNSNFSVLLSDTFGGDWGKEKAQGKYTVEVLCIRGTDIGSFNKGLHGKMPIRFIKSDKFNKCKLENGDIVIEVSGGSDDQSTGRTMYLTNEYLQMFDKPLICSNFCRVLRPKKKEYMYFLYLYFNYLYNRGEFFNLENGTSGIRNLDVNSLIEGIEFPMPNENSILDFNNRINILFRKIQANRNQMITLESLRDTLLPKLITGEIRVPV